MDADAATIIRQLVPGIEPPKKKTASLSKGRRAEVVFRKLEIYAQRELLDAMIRERLAVIPQTSACERGR